MSTQWSTKQDGKTLSKVQTTTNTNTAQET